MGGACLFFLLLRRDEQTIRRFGRCRPDGGWSVLSNGMERRMAGQAERAGAWRWRCVRRSEIGPTAMCGSRGSRVRGRIPACMRIVARSRACADTMPEHAFRTQSCFLEFLCCTSCAQCSFLGCVCICLPVCLVCVCCADYSLLVIVCLYMLDYLY